MAGENAGYSGRPLVSKLGLKAGGRAALIDAPEGYLALLGALPDGATVSANLDAPLDFIQVFVVGADTLRAQFPALKAALAADGMLWVSWPKRAAKVPTDLDENLIREIGLAHGLVDVKVIAVNAVWSGLKFVYRLKDRT